MESLKVYYLLNQDNEYIYHNTHEDEFINSVLRYLKKELFNIVDNYKTYVLHSDEYLEEMGRFIEIRRDIEKCNNILQLKHVAMKLDFKVKTKNIELD